MGQSLRKQVRRLLIIALACSFVGSAMYVSFAFGFRTGIAEDTVYVLPNC